MGSPLDNPLTDKSFLNSLLGQTNFDGIGINVVDMIEGERPPEAVQGEDGQMYANNVSIGPDGEWISNPNMSEPVYFYTQGLELGDARGNYFDVNDAGVVEQQGQWRTEAEIREQWDADEGMGYFKQENPNLDFDTYMDFISKSTALYNEGGAYAENAGAYQALAGEYGIAMSYQNDDGDVFEFNGSNFTKTSKVDDSTDVGGMIMSIALSAMTAGALAGPITTMLGSAGITGSAATAATKAITSMVTQLATTGDLDLKQALISAAMSYGGDKLGNAFANSAELDGAVSSITSKATETFDKMKGFIETGNSIADAAIKAGGMNLLTQMVSTGEINLEQAVMSAAIAGGSQGLMDLKTNVVETGVAAPEEVDEFMADLDEFEEFQQEAMNADIKDPFLNPNYTEVAEGLITNSAGEIFNYAGDAIGNMSDLDLDGDGMLNGDDLQNITVPDRDVISTLPNDHIDNVYGEGNMDEFPAVPTYSTTVGNFEEEWIDERYAGLSRQQTINALKASGFDDPKIAEYMEVYDARSSAIATDNYVTQFGSIDVNMDDPYTIGQTEEGVYYVAKHNGDTGEVSFKSITEGDYNELYERVYGQSGSAMGTGDWSEVEDYISSSGLANGGDEYSHYDPEGTQVLYNPDGSMYTGAYGSHTATETDDWITLNPPMDPNGYVPIDFNDDTKTPEKEEIVEKPEQPNANGDPNKSTDAGQGTGGGDTSSTGGEGAEGTVGGSGTVGGGAIPPVGNNTGGPGSTASGRPAGGNAGNAPSPDTVDPSNGTGTPVTPAMNSRIEELMARGMTYEQAVANQNAAIKAGADANEDGMVTNKEWSEHTGNVGSGGNTGGTNTGAGTGGTGGGASTGGGTGTGAGAGAGTGTGGSGTGSGGGGAGTGAGTGTGTGSGTGSGAGTGGDSGGGSGGTVGGGEGADPGVGSGTEPGSGGGAGNGGSGGNGSGMMGMAGSGGGVPFEKFSQLDPYVWQRFQKRRNPLINTAPTPTQNRRSLLSGLWNEAMK